MDGKLVHAIDYKDKFLEMLEKNASTVPQGPRPQLTPLSQTTPGMRKCIARLKELFTDRPIAIRRALIQTYTDRWGRGKTGLGEENWENLLRFCVPYVCYMFRSGPYRDAYVAHGIDPRKDNKWAVYQTVMFAFRGIRGAHKANEEDEEREPHIFTGKEVNTRVGIYSLCDVHDPLLRGIVDGSPLREQFHVFLVPT